MDKPEDKSKDAVARRSKKVIIWGMTLFMTIIFIPLYIFAMREFGIPWWWSLPFLLLIVVSAVVGARWGHKIWMQMHEGDK
jgi:uncharacterized membrane protein YfcA